VEGVGGTLSLRLELSPEDGRVDDWHLTGARFVTNAMTVESDGEFHPSRSDIAPFDLTDRQTIDFEDAPPAIYSRLNMDFADVELDFEDSDDSEVTLTVGRVIAQFRCDNVELMARGEARLEVELRVSEIVEAMEHAISEDADPTAAVADSLQSNAWECEVEDSP